MPRYAILVIWKDGSEEYVVHYRVGEPGQVAIYPSRRKAEEQADFMRIGMEGDCQSINVVHYKKPRIR